MNKAECKRIEKKYLKGIILIPIIIMSLFVVGNYMSPNSIPEDVTMYKESEWSLINSFLCTIERGEVIYGQHCNILQIILDPWHIFFTLALSVIALVIYILAGLIIIPIILFIRKKLNHNT